MGWLGGKYTVVQQLHSFSSQWLHVNDCTYTYFFSISVAVVHTRTLCKQFKSQQGFRYVFISPNDSLRDYLVRQ